MSRPRFLADHDLNEHVIAGILRQEPAIEFIRARDVEMSHRTDDEILQFAMLQQLLVVSHDVNTMPAAAQRRTLAGYQTQGLVMVQQSLPVGSVIDQLILIWSASELEEWRDSVVFLPL